MKVAELKKALQQHGLKPEGGKAAMAAALSEEGPSPSLTPTLTLTLTLYNPDPDPDPDPDPNPGPRCRQAGAFGDESRLRGIHERHRVAMSERGRSHRAPSAAPP